MAKNSDKKPQHFSTAPKSTKDAVMKDINKILKKHAVAGSVTALHVSVNAVTSAAVAVCPPGQRLVEVCRKLPTGQIVCETRCVAI